MKKNGKRLNELRKLNRLTLKEVGSKLGVDISLVSRWENDERQPNNNQLVELARLFGVTLNFLFDGQELVAVNFRTTLPKDSEEYKALTKVYLEALQNASGVKRIMSGSKRKISAQMPSFKVDSMDEIPGIVSQIKDFYRLNNIVSLDELKGALRDKGVFIFEWLMPHRVSGFTVSGECKVIYLNHAHTPERRLFTLAHELGHLLLHSDQPECSFESNLARRTQPEKEANTFANELLLSDVNLKKLVRESGTRLKNPAVLKSIAGVFNISPDALFYRLMQHRFFSPVERTNFVTPYLPQEVDFTFRVVNIEDQVDKEYLTTVYAEYIDDGISFTKLRDLLFTDENTLSEYLDKMESLIEDNIGKDDH